MRLLLARSICAVLCGAAVLVGTHRAAMAAVPLSPMDTATPRSDVLPRPGIGVSAGFAFTLEAALPAGEVTTSSTPATRPRAIEYSEAYGVRRKVHYIASFATLPLFATEYVLGTKLFDGDTSSGVRNAHTFVAGSLGVLFGLNTVTGVWNAYDTREEPVGRTRRLLHGALMLVADAGFVATAASAPESEEDEGPASSSDKNRHRALAIGSMSVATVSYLIMLIGR